MRLLIVVLVILNLIACIFLLSKYQLIHKDTYKINPSATRLQWYYSKPDNVIIDQSRESRESRIKRVKRIK